MSKLRVISENVPPAVFELSSGVISIGRREENHFQINHPTVSGQHCELIFADGNLVVKDLNSTNGTFIDDEAVRESPIAPGHVLRLGDICLKYEAPPQARIHVRPAEAQPSPEPLTETSTTGSPVQSPCYHHPQTEGDWVCTRCATVACDACIGKRVTPQKTWHYCKLCSAKVISLADHRQQLQSRAARNSLTFKQRVGTAFKYPFAKGGLVFLILGAFIFWVVDVAKMIVKFVPFYGWSALIILMVFSWGWLFSYMQRIITACANDEDVLPEWPEISEWGSDLVQPFLAWLGTLFICFSPAIIYSYYSAQHDFAPFLFYPIFLMGLIYLPMALLVVSMTGSLKSANPFVVLPAILKIPGHYSVICLFFIVSIGIWNGLMLVIDEFAPADSVTSAAIWKVAWNLPLGFVFLYLMVMCARALGMMYRCDRQTLGWFKH